MELDPFAIEHHSLFGLPLYGADSEALRYSIQYITSVFNSYFGGIKVRRFR